MSATNKNIESIYPLSPMQKGMFFHTILNEQSGVYFEQMNVCFKGDLKVDAFISAWENVVNRNSILRTAFVYKNIKEPLQVVHRNVKLPLEFIDWSEYSVETQDEKLLNFLEDDIQKGFNLSKAPLLRLTLIKLGEHYFKFIWSHHHILLDGWSTPILFSELFSTYEAIVNNIKPNLPSPQPYRNYINWLQKKDIKQSEKFWKKYLSNFKSPTPLIIDKLPSAEKSNNYSKKSIQLDKNTTTSLTKILKENGITLSTLIQAVWAIILSKYNNEDDVVFGATFSGRPPELAGSEFMVGLLINTLPVRAKINQEQSFNTWIKEFNNSQIDIRDFEHTPLFEIQKWSEVKNKQPLFNSIVVFENYPVDESLKNQKLSVEISDVNQYEKTNYPLTIVSAPSDQIKIEVAFDEDKLSEYAVDSLLKHFKVLLTNISNYPDRKIKELQIITEMEQKILSENNTIKEEYLENICIHQKFEKIVEKYPNNIAVRFEEKEITYKEIDAKANQLARHLQKQGVGPDYLVGILLNRSIEMMISILGVLKAGGAYLPIDTAYPDERINYIINDANLKVIITQDTYCSKIASTNIKTLSIEKWREIENEETDKVISGVFPENLAYVIYTSGSTGNPKGTLLRHRGVINFISHITDMESIDKNSVILQFSSIGFDASIEEIFTALLNGATLQLVKKELILESDNLEKLIQKNNVTTIALPPSLLTTLQPIKKSKLKSIKSVGETCSWEIPKKWSEGINFFNGYGPTEATVGSTYWKLTGKLNTPTVPIGKPIPNVSVFILDNNLNQVPIGVPGELYIAGEGLAVGYLNKPDLTAEKFIPNPFSNNNGLRMYKTRDLVRVLSDGQLEFLGRIDNQVKLRGFRIELGEIETVINNLEQVEQATVVMQGIDDKKLVAFILPKNSNKIDISEIKKQVSKYLPTFMMPSQFELIDKFPLTANGKIDKKKLEEYKIKTISISNHISKSKTPSEELLISLCREILQVDEINSNDNFFDMGGHSLKAAQLVARVRAAFNIELPIKQIFETNTISELAFLIDNIQKQEDGLEIPPLIKRKANAKPELSFSQKRLWFLDQLEPLKDTYNIPAAIKLTGKLNYITFEKSINAIIERHEVFRTSFISTEGKPAVKIHQHNNYELNIIDVTNNNGTKIVEINKIVDDAKGTIFNLEKGPLYKIQFVKLSNNEHILIVIMHHIISDGWSINVMIKELTEYYDSYSSKKEPKISKLEIQYSDYANWMNNWMKDDLLESKLKYWKEKLQGIPEVIELPHDFMRPPIQKFNGSVVNFKIDKDISKKLGEINKKEGLTNFMSLLTVFQILLSKYSRQDDIVIGSPIANRTHSQIENLIGFFVNTLIIRTQLNNNSTMLETLKQTRKTTLEAFSNNDVPFEQIVDAVQPERSMSHSPLFQVAFVYQNASNESFKLKEINIENYNFENTTSKYDITLYITENKGELFCSFEYNIDLFKKATIERLTNHFNKILDQVVINPKMKLNDITLLPDSEYVELVEKLNRTNKEFEENRCIHNVFEDVVVHQPEATAISFSEFENNTLFTNELSYNELNLKANKLANYLINNGIKTESMVAISTARSLDLIISVMAILKTGGAFLPIDPTYPDERIKYMLEDSGVSVVITQSNFSSIFSSFGGKVIQLDIDEDEIEKEDDKNISVSIIPQNLAYIIYTSGTTGKPKGTLLQHQGAINLAEVQKRVFDITQESKIFQFSSLSFDAFVWETVMALLNGASLNLASQEIITSGEDLVKTFIGLGITTVTLPPSVLSIIPAEYATQENLSKLKTLIVAGEKCSSELTNRWVPNRNFINAYGPTETTVCASMHFCEPSCRKSPPIGNAVDNFQLFVLDKNLNPVPVGVPGELYISGVGLSRGYHNKPNLTAEKFIPNPFSNEIGIRMYKTGDLVKYLPNREIQFIGRVDSQVKLRGFRIEIGEIETVISRFVSINEVIVVVREDKPGIKQLVAYFTTSNNKPLDIAQLRTFIRKELPEYMIPTAYINLEKFPLTPNKKVDFKTLPLPSIADKVNKVKYVEPRNETEKIIAEIGKELLGIEQMGVYDSFFDLGGHSLLATQFVSKLKTEFNKDIPLRLLFENSTIDELGKVIMDLSEQTDEDKIEKQDRGDEDLSELISEIRDLSDEDVLQMINDNNTSEGN